MKNKYVAAFLALGFGILGVHRFYLGRRFWGVLHLLLFFITLTITIDGQGDAILFPAILGLVDAILLFAMPVEDFDDRYNAKRILQRMRRQEAEDEYAGDEAPEAPRPRSEKYAKRSAYSDEFLKKLGIDKFRSGDFAGAVEAFRESIEQGMDTPAMHFNLACCFSMLHDAPSGFEHLEKAVARGFAETDKIGNHAALHYLRIQPEFAAFVANGYRRRPASPSGPAPTQAPTSGAAPVIDELFQLGELMEKGLISQEEFRREKEKLLRQ